MANILYNANPPMFRNHPFLFVLSVLAIIAFGLGLLIFLYWYLWSKSRLFTITDSEIRYEQGLLSKRRVELGRTKVRSLRVYQSFAQRILGTGDIQIFTAGDTPEIELSGFPDPHIIRALIDTTLN